MTEIFDAAEFSAAQEPTAFETLDRVSEDPLGVRAVLISPTLSELLEHVGSSHHRRAFYQLAFAAKLSRQSLHQQRVRPAGFAMLHARRAFLDDGGLH